MDFPKIVPGRLMVIMDRSTTWKISGNFIGETLDEGGFYIIKKYCLFLYPTSDILIDNAGNSILKIL